MSSDTPKIILASGSPRRQALLSLIVDYFSSVSLDIDESFPETISTEEVASFLAQKKRKLPEKSGIQIP